MPIRVDYQLSAGTGVFGEPLRMSNFELVIAAIPGVSLMCNTVALPGVTIAPQEVHHFNEKLKIAGDVDWSTIPIEIRDTIDPDTAFAVDAWLSRVYNARTGVIGYASEYKEECTIQQYDSKGILRREWDLIGVWPTNWTPGQLDKTSREPVVMSVELSIDRGIPRFGATGALAQLPGLVQALT